MDAHFEIELDSHRHPRDSARVLREDAEAAQEANNALLILREYDRWAWAPGIALIWADLALPVPQTAVIAALKGIIYGTLLGGLLGSVGLISGGLLGYGLMRTSARRFGQTRGGRPVSLHKMETLFDRAGDWAIILTRSLPYSVPEVMVFLAGLAGMPMGKFTMALTVGNVTNRLGVRGHRCGLGRSASPGAHRKLCPSRSCCSPSRCT